ncbi:MAG: germination protein Ger(x)C [Firmicutes bacterium]|nr:germination protein Ger(x)C [Bacillota bacterium]
MWQRRLIPVIICILLSTMLTGCWNRKELNAIGIVQGIGIDKTPEGQIRITFQVLKPSSKGGGKEGGSDKAVWVTTSVGATIQDTVRNATKQSGRKFYVGHCKVIVIGEEVSREGIEQFVEIFQRDHEFRPDVLLFIARGKAQDVIEADNLQEKVPASGIANLATATFATSNVPKVTLHDFAKTLASKTSAPFIPGIEVVEGKKDGKPIKVVQIDNTAVFKQDKLIGWLNKKEARGMLWLLGKVKSGTVVVNSPQDETQRVSLEIIRAASDVDVEVINNQIIMKVIIKEEGNLAEQASAVNLFTPDIIHELEARKRAGIEDEVNAALLKAQQELDADVFKFGEEVHRRNPKLWKDLKKKWDQEFPKVLVKLMIEVRLNRIGLHKRPQTAEEEG